MFNDSNWSNNNSKNEIVKDEQRLYKMLYYRHPQKSMVGGMLQNSTMQCSFNSTLNFYIQQFYVFIFNDCLRLLSTLVFNIQLQRCIFTFKVHIHSTPTLCVCLTERPLEFCNIPPTIKKLVAFVECHLIHAGVICRLKLEF